MSKVTREEIIEAAKQATIKHGSPLSRSDFLRITGISSHQIYRLFPKGGWSELKRLANLEPHPHKTAYLSDNDLLIEFHHVVTKINDIPTWFVFGSHAKISADVIRRRFGGIQGTLKSYRKWLLNNHPNSPLIRIVVSKLKQENLSVELVSPPNLQVTSEAVEQALADTEQLIRTQGALSGVDRVHTAFHGYLIAIVKKLNLPVKKDIELTELFQIVRDNHPDLRQDDSATSEITKIFRGASKILDAVNNLRNQGSLAHPNQNLLKEPEAMLVINVIRTLLHYLNSKIKNS